MKHPLFRLPPVVVPLIDQGAISAGTFLFNVALVREIPLPDYGRFALIIGNLLLMQVICGSLIFYPLSIRGAALDDAGRKRLTVTALILTGMLGVPLAVTLTACLWRYIGDALVLPTLAVFVAGQAQEAARRGLLTGFRYGAAIPGDMLSYCGQAAMLFLAAWFFDVGLEGALWIMASTSLAATALQMLQLELRGVRSVSLASTVADFWRIGRWPLASNLLGIARTLSVPWLLTAVAGPSAAGGFQIALNLINVANPIVIGVCNVIPQVAARAFRFGYRAAWLAAWPSIGAGLVLIAGFAVLLLLGTERISTLVYGDRLEIVGIAGVVRLLAIGILFNYMASVLFAFLCGVLAGRLALVADCVSALAMVLMLPPSAIFYGLNGAAVALTVAVALRAILLGVYTAKRVHRAEAAGGVGVRSIQDGQETLA